MKTKQLVQEAAGAGCLSLAGLFPDGGVALAGTAVWLGSILWVLAGQGATIGLAVLATALLVWLVLPVVRLRLPVAAALVLAGLLVPAFLGSPEQAKYASQKGDSVWVPFSQDYLADLVASGQVVMVDVTADWCITCKANKAAVLDRGQVAALLGSEPLTMAQVSKLL